MTVSTPASRIKWRRNFIDTAITVGYFSSHVCIKTEISAYCRNRLQHISSFVNVTVYAHNQQNATFHQSFRNRIPRYTHVKYNRLIHTDQRKTKMDMYRVDQKMRPFSLIADIIKKTLPICVDNSQKINK